MKSVLFYLVIGGALVFIYIRQEKFCDYTNRSASAIPCITTNKIEETYQQPDFTRAAPRYKVVTNGSKFRAVRLDGSRVGIGDCDNAQRAYQITWIAYQMDWDAAHPNTNAWVEVK